ncbi:MAG: PAS domain-containing protein [Cyclobacteriaceae bacterium]|nr:PAS domain-containing protein [Cyclobacteriaceae bacterium]
MSFLLQFYNSSLLMSMLAIAYLGLAFVMRTHVSLVFISTFYLVLSYIGSVILVLMTGLMYSALLPWLAFIPMSANLIINRKAALVWLAVCFVTVFFVAFYLPQGMANIPVQYDRSYDAFFYSTTYNGLTGIILVLSMAFQKAKDSVYTVLEDKNRIISSINLELKSKNDEIIAQNEELLQQKEEITAQREFIEIKNRELLLVQQELNELVDKLTNTQHNLARREAENRSILDSIYGTQLLVGELDLNGKILKMSPEAAKFLQLGNEDIIGKTFNELSNITGMSFGKNLDFETLWKQLLDGHNLSHDVHLQRGEAEYWLKQNFFPILGANARPIKIMIVAQDISQIKNQQMEIEMLNIDLQENIWKIEKQNHLLVRQRQEIEHINEELKQSNEEIRNINQNLENRVKERTQYLEAQNKQLSEYAYINAHLLRGPMCSILGLVNLMATSKPNDAEPLIFHMQKSSQELRAVVDKISKAIEKGGHFDRNLIYKN